MSIYNLRYKIDKLSVRLYDINKKIDDIDENARKQYRDCANPYHYYESVMTSPEYINLMNKKNVTESELNFSIKYLNKLESMCEYTESVEH